MWEPNSIVFSQLVEGFDPLHLVYRPLNSEEAPHNILEQWLGWLSMVIERRLNDSNYGQTSIKQQRAHPYKK